MVVAIRGAHTGAGERHRVVVAPPGVGRQIDAVGVQPIQATVIANDRVIQPRAHPGVGRGGPVQVDRLGLAGTCWILQQGAISSNNDGSLQEAMIRRQLEMDQRDNDHHEGREEQGGGDQHTLRGYARPGRASPGPIATNSETLGSTDDHLAPASLVRRSNPTFAHAQVSDVQCEALSRYVFARKQAICHRGRISSDHRKTRAFPSRLIHPCIGIPRPGFRIGTRSRQGH